MSKAKIYLTDSWIYAGKTFLPGEHEVDQPVYDSLLKRGAITAPAEAPKAGTKGTKGKGSATPADLETLVGPDIAGKLAAAGFDTLEAVKGASNEQLLAVEGVGDVTLAKLRGEG